MILVVLALLLWWETMNSMSKKSGELDSIEGVIPHLELHTDLPPAPDSHDGSSNRTVLSPPLKPFHWPLERWSQTLKSTVC